MGPGTFALAHRISAYGKAGDTEVKRGGSPLDNGQTLRIDLLRVG